MTLLLFSTSLKYNSYQVVEKCPLRITRQVLIIINYCINSIPHNFFKDFNVQC